jgi:NAD(P)-dependent dehydrogenase (short-subunit alcohol dehydrogenase family)
MESIVQSHNVYESSTADAAQRDHGTILVTGGGAVAHGIVVALRDGGFPVVVVAHRPSAVPLSGITVEVADLLDLAAIPDRIGRLIDQHRPLAGLVCLASGFTGGSFLQADGDTWREVVDLHLQSAIATVRAVAPHLLARGRGSVVIVATRPAFEPSPGSAAVDAAHAAVAAMTRALAREFDGSGVTVNCLLPATLDTPQARAAQPHADTAAWVSPEALGRVVGFLCSEAGRVISGATLPLVSPGTP